MIKRCPLRVQWYGYDMTVRCRREEHHPGDHTDGLWWFDDDGLRRPSATEITATTPRLIPRVTEPTGVTPPTVPDPQWAEWYRQARKEILRNVLTGAP